MPRTPTIALPAVAALALYAFASPAVADPMACRRDAMIVFDTSGSMSLRETPERSRLEVARQAAQSVLPEATAGRRAGLVTFGPSNCAAQLRLPPTAAAGAAIHAELDAVRPMGPTPIGQAVETAVTNLPGQGIVLVFTDGQENCGSDLCALGHRLRATAPGLVVHVLGFKLPDRASVGAACLAEATGGRYFSTQSGDEVANAFREALICPKVSVRKR